MSDLIPAMTVLRELAERWKRRASLSEKWEKLANGKGDLAFANNKCADELIQILDAEDNDRTVDVQRYTLQHRPDWAYNQASMMPAKDGAYVLWADIEAVSVESRQQARSGVVSDEDVPDALKDDLAATVNGKGYIRGWNDCRKAMLDKQAK